jgi:hypothetical protein
MVNSGLWRTLMPQAVKLVVEDAVKAPTSKRLQVQLGRDARRNILV